MPRPEEPIEAQELVEAQIQQEIQNQNNKNYKKRPASKDLGGNSKRLMDIDQETERAEEAPTPCPNRQPEEPPRPTHNRTRSNFSPFIGAIPRYPIVGKTPKATSIEEALEIARNLVIQAANLAENNPTRQSSLLDLVEVFRDYTENGRINKKNSAILGDQISSLSNVSKELREKIRRLEKPNTQPTQPTQPTSSYAAVAANNQEQPWITIQKQNEKNAQKNTEKNKPKKTTSLSDRQIVLVSDTPTAFDALKIRNAFNRAFTTKGGVQSPVVASVTGSAKGNKIITTTPAFTAKYLLENEVIWKDITDFKTAQPITPWFKVVIHKLPTNHSLEVLKEEIEIFNKGLKVVGNPFWLTPEARRESQNFGSACVAFATEEEAQRAIRGKLYILGQSLRAEKLRVINNSKQCSKCQGFGHLETRCQKIACQICSEAHHTSLHKCKSCATKGKPCVHTIFKCVNCSKPHAANSQDCEILQARIARTTTSSN
jgi:hypothetical protein